MERPVPVPGHGQVLVRINAAPINPSDLMFIRGLYGFKKPLPAVPGFEGSGAVVAAGGGLIARLLEGRRVACATARPDIRDGTWAEYAVTSARLAVPLRRDLDFEQGAMLLVNPLSAWAQIAITRRGGHRAIVQTAAASALGQMVLRLARRTGITVINVVRKVQQVETLRGLGAAPECVLNSNDPDFDRRLSELCQRLDATLAFDAVAGEMTGRLLKAMPRGSRVMVYGALSLEPARFDPALLIFEGKRVEGFWLTEWLRTHSLFSQFRLLRQVQELVVANEFASHVQARLPLTAVAEALARYATNMSGGKVLLVPTLD